MNIKRFIHKYNMDSEDELPLYITCEFLKENTHNDNHTKIKNIYASPNCLSIIKIEFEYSGENYRKPSHLLNNKKYTNLHKAVYDDLTDSNYDAKFERILNNMPIEELIYLMEKYNCKKTSENDKYTLAHTVEYEFKVTKEVKYNKLSIFKEYPLIDKESRFIIKILFPEKEKVSQFSVRMFAKYCGCSSLEIDSGHNVFNKAWRKKINRNKGYEHRLKKHFDTLI